MMTAYVAAKKAVKGGEIKIGWSMCRIKERVVPDFWNCRGEMSERRCLKCGGFGHLAAKKAEGHREVPSV